MAQFPSVQAAPQTASPRAVAATTKHLRGSSLLLCGRFLAIGINFAAQVLMVRYLTTQDYGAFAYALAMVLFFEAFASLGLKRSIARFIPIYHEKEEFGKLFGTIALVLATITATGVLIIGATHLWPGLIEQLVNEKGPQTRLLLVLIFMVPLQALDEVLIALFASFASSRAIFFRRYVLSPALRLAVVLLLVMLKADVIFVAYGYLAATLVGVALYSGIFVDLLRKKGVLRYFKLELVRIPLKEILVFTIPLLTSDLVTVVMHSLDTMVLGYFHSSSEVAMYRVVLPAVAFNSTVMTSFALLYMPLASRLFAKEDYEGINRLYWRTAVWMTVLTFPIFLLTFSLARPFVLTLYGSRYDAAWPLLQMMSFAYYFNVVLGFNGLTLQVLNRLRCVVAINIATVIINLLLVVLLIPKYGAWGAAWATTGALVVHNLLKQAGLVTTGAGVHIFERQYLRFYGLIAAGAFGVFLFQRFLSKSVLFGGAMAALVSLLILLKSRLDLQIAETFPEFQKLPLIRTLVTPSRPDRESC